MTYVREKTSVDGIENQMQKKIFITTGLSDIEVVGNQSLRYSVRYLSQFGYKISLFSFMPQDYPNLEDPKNIINSNVELYRLPTMLSHLLWIGKKTKDSIGKLKKKKRINPNQALSYYEEYNWLGRISYLAILLIYLPVELLRVSLRCLKTKPDVFYGVNWQGALVASLLGNIFRKPVITRFHGTSVKGTDLLGFKRKMWVFDEYIAMKVSSDAVIMTNDGTQGDKILDLLNVDKKNVHFWMNGLDVDNLLLPQDWNPVALKKSLGLQGKKVLLTVSRLAGWKRVDRSIVSVHKLINKHNMTDIVLLVIGEGPERIKLEKLAESLGIKDSVRFLGGVSHKKIIEYFSIADVFLTLYDISNLCNPLLEAMYLGLPIVTIEDGSTSHLLRNGHNAFLVKMETLSEEVPERIKKLLEDEMLKDQFKHNAKTTFQREVLTWKKRMLLEDGLIRKIIRD